MLNSWVELRRPNLFSLIESRIASHFEKSYAVFCLK